MDVCRLAVGGRRRGLTGSYCFETSPSFSHLHRGLRELTLFLQPPIGASPSQWGITVVREGSEEFDEAAVYSELELLI